MRIERIVDLLLLAGQTYIIVSLALIGLKQNKLLRQSLPNVPKESLLIMLIGKWDALIDRIILYYALRVLKYNITYKSTGVYTVEYKYYFGDKLQATYEWDRNEFLLEPSLYTLSKLVRVVNRLKSEPRRTYWTYSSHLPVREAEK